MSDLAVAAPFAQVSANPYAWPFDGRWSAGDTALLVLGFQPDTVAALGADGALRAARALLILARENGLLVVAARRERDATAFAANTPDWTWARGLELPDAALVVSFGGDNAFYRTGLEASLRQRGIRNLLIAGLPTEGLVHASQRTANDMGFECLTIADACQGTSTARHDAQLRITVFGNGLFGAVATVPDVASAIGRSRGA